METVTHPDATMQAALLDTILTEAPVGLALLDTELRFLRANEALAAVDGMSADSYPGRTVREVVPHLWPMLEPHLRRALAGEVVVNREISGETHAAPGEHRHWWASYYPVYLREKVVGVGVVVIEVTAQRRAEEALRESEERLRCAVDAADVGTWRFDLRTGLDTRDASLNRILGLESRDSTQPVEDFFSRIHSEDRLRANEAWYDAMQGKDLYDVEIRIVRPDGTVRWVRDRGRVVRASDGTPLYLTGALADIHDRRNAEVIRQSEARFETIANTAPAMLWMSDENYECTFLNRDAREFIGLAEADALGHGWMERIHPDDQERVGSAAKAAAGAPISLDCRVLRADGEYRWVSVAARPRKSENGRFLGYVGSNIDVHERHQAQESLTEANRGKDQFLAMLGHELRNPLAAIRNAAELVKQMKLEDPRLHRVQGVLERQSVQMTRLVEGLLEVTRIARGKISLERRTIDLALLLEEVLQDRSADFAAARLTLRRRLASEPIWVWADDARLVQVFDNLIGNAIRFTEPGGEVSVSLGVEAGRARFSVRDTGVGIRPEMLSRVFEPFQQESQEIARTSGGLGLGLALVKGLVELHGGSVEAESAGPGTGAEFRVLLSLVPPPTVDPADDQSRTSAPRRILIVEDIADTAQTLRDLLESQGHHVAVAETGLKALDYLHHFGADVVLCDIGLPGMSGLDVARAVRADDSLCSVRLIALTGYGQPEDRARAQAAGFDEHLTKPVDLRVLDEVLGAT